MNSNDSLKRRWVPQAIIMVAAAWGCTQSDPQSPSATGLDDFRRAVEASYQRLASGTIRKKEGFFDECSVDWGTKYGIRVSETVCDDGENAWSVTIRVTDPSSRPPSQRQTQFSMTLDDDRTLTVRREQKQQLPNGIALRLDRTGQSVILEGRVNIEP